MELSNIQRSLSVRNGCMHHPDELHMTLVFLGRMDFERLSCIRKIAAGITVKPFTLELTGVDYWKRPRILWCGPDLTPNPLGELVHDLQQGLSGCGFEPENRTYRPHVTLARKAGPAQVRRLDKPVIWSPREFVLAGSHSGNKPPRYSVFDRWSI